MNISSFYTKDDFAPKSRLSEIYESLKRYFDKYATFSETPEYLLRLSKANDILKEHLDKIQVGTGVSLTDLAIIFHITQRVNYSYCGAC